jgi:hypothetical protein
LNLKLALLYLKKPYPYYMGCILILYPCQTRPNPYPWPMGTGFGRCG